MHKFKHKFNIIKNHIDNFVRNFINNSTPKTKFKAASLAIIIIVLLGFLLHYFRNNKNINYQAPILVTVAPAKLADVPLDISAVGTVVTYQTVDLRSRIDSQVVAVKFRDGDYVNKGDLLFVLDDRVLQAQLKEQQANLARNLAQMENLYKQQMRNKELSEKGFESVANLDDSKAAYEAARADVAATKAAIDNLKVQLQYTRITAPIAGRSGTINITVGNNIKANDTKSLVVINQTKPIRVQFSLPQNYLEPVRSAMKAAKIIILANLKNSATENLQGKLDYIDNGIDSATGTFAARASFANKEEFLWPGMFVNLTIKLGEEKQVLTVLATAIQHGQDGDFVFVIDQISNKAHKRNVQIARQEKDIMVIAAGLNDGELVAMDGLMSLSDGSDIRIKN